MRTSLLAPLAPATLALAALALPGTASAQNAVTGPSVAAGDTLLTVSAEGTSARKPDLAVFSAGVASTGKTAGEALSANARDMNGVLAALKRAGIAERDIQTSNLDLSPVYADNSRVPNGQLERQTPQIVGYRAQNTVTVRQRKLEDFGKVIDTLVSAGANQVNGPSFQLDDDEAAMDEARTEAIAKARQRAELYAKAAGLRVVRILSIDENGGGSAPPMPFARMASAKAESTPVAPGEVSVSANVTVQFDLSR